MQCHRCGRNLTRPTFISGFAYGSTCALQINGTKPKRTREVLASPGPRSKRRTTAQMDWVEEISSESACVTAVTSL